MSFQQEGTAEFVEALGKLSATQLERLRRATGRPRGQDVEVNDLFNDLWRPLRDRYRSVPRDALYLVATLFPWNRRRPEPGENLPHDLGDAFRLLQNRSGKKYQDRKRFEHRFLCLLDSRGPELEARLLEAVRLLERQDVPVDWRRLAADLAGWESPGRPVQERWFRHFKGLGEPQKGE